VTDDLGRGAYRVDVDNRGALSNVAETEHAIQDAGAAADTTGQKATQAFEKTGSAASSAERSVGRVGPVTRLTFGAIAGITGLATRGVVQLDDITAKYTASTGASADEAERARSSILRMSRDNLQPMGEIGDALAKVHTDMNLTGGAADDTALRFLKFSRVTGENAATEVGNLDDILDAWNLTADKSQGIMDALIVSHQKYGGSIAGNEAALRDLAPTLTAANLQWQDGLGLINLFQQAGADSQVAITGITSALSKVKSPEELQRLIADISNTVDPFERAQKAADLFGQRAGSKLANVLKPGIGSIDQFKISTEEATGATDRARGVLDDTWGSRFKLMLKDAGASVLEFADQFGPVTTAAASVASLAGGLGIDTFVRKFGGRMLDAGKQGGEALIDGMSVVVGAAGTVVGNLVAQALDPNNPFLNGAIGRAATKAGLLWGVTFGAAETLYLRALFAKDDITTALAGSWTRVAGTGSLATKAAGLAGRAAGFAFNLGLVAALAEAADTVEPAVTKLGQDIHNAILPGVHIDPSEWEWPIGPKNAPDWAGGSTKTGVEEGFDRLGQFPGKVADDFVAAVPEVTTAYQAIADPLAKAMKNARSAAVAIAHSTPLEIAQSLVRARDPIASASDLLKQAFEDHISPMKEIAQLEGDLAGKRMKRALNSHDPNIRAAGEAWKAAVEDRLYALRNGVGDTALKTGQNYSDALKTKRGEVQKAANALTRPAEERMENLQRLAYGYGANTAGAYASGLIGGLNTADVAVRRKLNEIREDLQAKSPPGPRSPLHEIDKWGFNTGMAWVDGLAGAIEGGASRVRGAIAGVSGFGLPGAVAPGLPAPGAMLRGEITLTVRDPDGGLERAGLPPAELGTRLTDELAGILDSAYANRSLRWSAG
jgi:hypothetical protein